MGEAFTGEVVCAGTVVTAAVAVVSVGSGVVSTASRTGSADVDTSTTMVEVGLNDSTVAVLVPGTGTSVRESSSVSNTWAFTTAATELAVSTPATESRVAVRAFTTTSVRNRRAELPP